MAFDKKIAELTVDFSASLTRLNQAFGEVQTKVEALNKSFSSLSQTYTITVKYDSLKEASSYAATLATQLKEIGRQEPWEIKIKTSMSKEDKEILKGSKKGGTVKVNKDNTARDGGSPIEDLHAKNEKLMNMQLRHGFVMKTNYREPGAPPAWNAFHPLSKLAVGDKGSLRLNSDVLNTLQAETKKQNKQKTSTTKADNEKKVEEVSDFADKFTKQLTDLADRYDSLNEKWGKYDLDKLSKDTLKRRANEYANLFENTRLGIKGRAKVRTQEDLPDSAKEFIKNAEMKGTVNRGDIGKVVKDVEGALNKGKPYEMFVPPQKSAIEKAMTAFNDMSEIENQILEESWALKNRMRGLSVSNGSLRLGGATALESRYASIAGLRGEIAEKGMSTSTVRNFVAGNTQGWIGNVPGASSTAAQLSADPAYGRNLMRVDKEQAKRQREELWAQRRVERQRGRQPSYTPMESVADFFGSVDNSIERSMRHLNRWGRIANYASRVQGTFNEKFSEYAEEISRNPILRGYYRTRDLGREMQFGGLGLMAAGAMPFVGAAGAATMAGDYEYQRQWLRANIAKGDTAAMHSMQTEALLGQFDSLAMYGQTKYSPTEIVNASAEMVKYGFQGADALNAMGAAMQLANMEGIGLEESVAAIANVLNAFSMDASEATNVANALANAAQNGAMTFDQLAKALTYTNEVTNILGWDYTQVLAGMQAASTQGGLTPERIGLYMRSLENSLEGIYSNKRMQALSRGFGVNLIDSSTYQVASLDQIVEDVEKVQARMNKTGKYGHASFMNVMGQMFPPEQLNLIMSMMKKSQAITNDWYDDVAKKQYKVGDIISGSAYIRWQSYMNKNSKTLSPYNEEMWDTFKGSITKLKQAFYDLALVVAQSGLLEALTKMANGMTGLVLSFQKFTKGQAATIAIVMSLASAVIAVGAGLFVLGSSLKILSNMALGAELLYTMFTMVIKPVWAVAKVLPNVAFGAESASGSISVLSNVAKLATSTTAIFATAILSVAAAMVWLAATDKTVQKQLNDIWVSLNKDWPEIATAVQLLGTAFNYVLGGIGTSISGIIDMVSGIAGMVAAPIALVARLIYDVIAITYWGYTTLRKVIGALIGGNSWDEASQAFAKVSENFIQIFKDVWYELNQFINSLVKAVWGYVKMLLGPFIYLYDELVGHSIIPDLVVAVKKWLVTFLKVLTSPLSFIKKALNGIVDVFEKTLGGVADFLNNLGFIKTLREMFDPIQVVQAMTGLLTGIWDFLTNIPGRVVSALVGFFNLGTSIIQSIIDGVTTKGSQILNTIWGYVVGIPVAVIGAISGFYNMGVSIVTSIVEGIKSMPSAVVDAVKSLVTSVPGGSVIWNALSTAYNVGKKAMGIGQYASGGIFNSPTLGIIGEAGPEAVLPLSYLKNMYLPEMASYTAQRTSQAGYGGPVTINVDLDGRNICRGTAPYLSEYINLTTQNTW